MNERDVAVICTHIGVAIRQCLPQRLDPVIEELSITPWNYEVVEILKTIRYVLYAERHANRNKSQKSRK